MTEDLGLFGGTALLGVTALPFDGTGTDTSSSSICNPVVPVVPVVFIAEAFLLTALTLP